MAKRSRKKNHLNPEDREAMSPPVTTIQRFFSGPWMPVLLAVITFLVYTPSLRSDFILDARAEIDEGFVTSVSNLPKILSLQVLGMHRLMLADRPGLMLYLMLNVVLWGKAPFGFHLGSNLLHATNVALLLALLRRLVAMEIGPVLLNSLKVQLALVSATLIFALHPIVTESVAEVSFSSNLLVTLFTLLGLLAATAFRPDNLKAALLAGGLATFCAFGAVLTKESGITLGPLLIVYWFLFRRREAKGPWFFFLAAALAATFTVISLILLFAIPSQMKLDYLGGSFGQVFLIQPQVWDFMMGQLLWPTRLCADYTLVDMNVPSTPLALVILAAVLAFQVWLARRSRLGALGAATWWIGLSTVSNFFPLYCFLADRFYYLPLAGLVMQLVAVFLLLLRSRRAYALAVGVTLATLPFLTSLTVARQAVFATEPALWADILQKSPHSFWPHYDRGKALIKQGRLQEAADEIALGITSTTEHSSIFAICMGLVDECRGQFDQAIIEFQKALALNPQNSDAHCDLGVSLCQEGRFDEGMEQLHEALALDPDNVSASTNLGLALIQLGQVQPGIEQLRLALEDDPNFVLAHFGLGNALAQVGQLDQAAEQFQQVLQLNPNHVEAGTNLGVVYLHQGRLDQAISQFQQTLKLRPESADLHDNLGVALAQKGELAEAMAQFREALRLKPDFDSAQINLAKAQASAAPSSSNAQKAK